MFRLSYELWFVEEGWENCLSSDKLHLTLIKTKASRWMHYTLARPMRLTDVVRLTVCKLWL